MWEPILYKHIYKPLYGKNEVTHGEKRSFCRFCKSTAIQPGPDFGRSDGEIKNALFKEETEDSY
jgi:hypothetical protein